MMDKLIETVVLGLPNFAGLVLVLYWQQQANARLLERVDELIDKIVECYEKPARDE